MSQDAANFKLNSETTVDKATSMVADYIVNRTGVIEQSRPTAETPQNKTKLNLIFRNYSLHIYK